MRNILLLTILAVQPIPCVAAPYPSQLQGKLENVVENYTVAELIAQTSDFEVCGLSGPHVYRLVF